MDVNEILEKNCSDPECKKDHYYDVNGRYVWRFHVDNSPGKKREIKE